MSNPAKTVNIPVESHGLHRHIANVPRLFTTNFFEHIPVFCQDFEKGNRIKYKWSFFNRLNPLPVPALVTGETRVYGFYVPFESIFKGWYDFRAKTEHNFSDGTTAKISSARYVNMGLLNQAFINDPNLCTAMTGASGWDFQYMDLSNVLHHYTFTTFGTVVYKVLCALGLPLSFYEGDNLEPNCLKVLGYVRLMYDHFFPLQYVGNTPSQRIMAVMVDDTVSGLHVSETDLLDMVGHVVQGWFDNSWIESAWDNPVAPNAPGVGAIDISDQTNNSSVVQGVSNTNSSVNPGYQPSNGTPHQVSDYNTGSGTVVGSLTQFVLDALQSVNNFIKRRGLSGNRLIENYLSQHGVALPSGIYDQSIKLDQYSIPFEITDVESNSSLGLDSNGNLNDVSLGELGGKGRTSGKDLPFNHRFDRDGLFYIIQVAVPDSEPLLAFDPFNLCKSSNDFRVGAFEKLGVDVVPSRVLFQDNSGFHNSQINSQNWGFWKRYYYGNVDLPLYFGDFRVPNRGASSLRQYHTFRGLWDYVALNSWNLAHSYDFLRVGNDVHQFGRIFYTDKVDNMTIVGRLKGKRWTSFLPLGDSYDWDDDAMNERVTLQNVGNDAI